MWEHSSARMWEHSSARMRERMRASPTTAMGRPPVLAITAMGSLCAPSARLGTFVRAPATQSGTETNNVDANYPGNVDANYPGSAEAAGPPGRMQAAQQRGCERPSGADAGEHHHRDERAFVCLFGAVGHVRTGSRDPSGLTRPMRAHATRAGTRAPERAQPRTRGCEQASGLGRPGPVAARAALRLAFAALRQVFLELLRDRLTTRLRLIDGVTRLLELLDVGRHVFVLAG